MCCHLLFIVFLVRAIVGRKAFFSQTDAFADVENDWFNRWKCQAEENQFTVVCLLPLNNAAGALFPFVATFATLKSTFFSTKLKKKKSYMPPPNIEPRTSRMITSLSYHSNTWLILEISAKFNYKRCA